MPSNLMLSEQSLPKFTEGQGDRERIAAKYGYALEFMEARGYTFDAADMQALIDAKVWELFNQFKDGGDTPEA